MLPTNWHFIKVLIILFGLSAASCGGGGGGSTPPHIFAELDSLSPGSSLTGFQNASVYVTDDNNGPPISTAIVTINGVTLPYNAADERYEGNVDVAPGAAVTLSVTVRGKIYTASGTQFTSFPTIAEPVTGAIWHRAYASYVAWTKGGTTTNAIYGLGVLDADNPNKQLLWPANGSLQMLGTGQTSASIPQDSLTLGNRLFILGIWTFADIPDAAPGSNFAIGGFNYVPVTVADASLTSIEVLPINPTVPSGLTQQFTAIGSFSDKTTQNLTGQVTWVSSNTDSVQFKYYDPGLAYCLWGSSTISATLESFSDSTTLTITPAILMSIYSISPLDSMISKGITKEFTAVGMYSDGGTRGITSLVNWSSSDERIASISNAAGSNGKATGLSTGTTTITATVGNLSRSTTLTVTNWTFANSGTSLDLFGIAWSGNQFVAVGDRNVNTGNSTILTSPNGTTWTTQTPGYFYTLFGATWLGSEFAAAGQSGTIITSPTGVSWTPHPTGTYNPLCGFAWSGTQYVATGSLLVLSSPDKAVWTSRVLGLTNTQNDVIWSGTQFLTVGYGGKIFASPDGISWTQRISGTTNSLNGVVWSGTQFVAVGENGTVLTSPDGVVWTAQTSGVSKTLNRIAWSGKEFLAVGYGVIITSPDAVTWTKPVLGTVSPLRTLYGVTAFGERFVAVGERGTILISP